LLQTEDILRDPLGYADFSLTVPTGPGLGIAFDEDKLAFFRRDRTSPILHAVTAGA
jgi:muconate cycloisomerase